MYHPAAAASHMSWPYSNQKWGRGVFLQLLSSLSCCVARFKCKMFNVLYISSCHVLPSVDIFAEYQVNIQFKLPINYLGPGETRGKYSGHIRFVAELTRDNTDKKYVRNVGVSSYHPPPTTQSVSPRSRVSLVRVTLVRGVVTLSIWARHIFCFNHLHPEYWWVTLALGHRV